MYTYFVRRHLNRVAEKCQEESRKIQAEAADARSSQQQLKDINLIYRQLVRLMRIHRAAI
jgi:pantothenate kinase